jgi:hypothetical protein
MDKKVQSFVRKLRTQLEERFAAKISAALECEPKLAARGEQIKARVRIFAPEKKLAELKPVLRSPHSADFAERKFLRRGQTQQYADYFLAFDSKRLGDGKQFHLTVHPNSDEPPIARCVVQVLSPRAVGAARSRIREQLQPRFAPRQLSSRSVGRKKPAE